MGDRRFRDRLMKDAADNLKIAAAEFDTHPFLINCKNGTYDLESLTFREHKWDDFLTMQTNFEYGVKKEKCARWEQFIKEVNSDIEYLAMMTDIEMEQEEDEQEVQDHGEEE